ncbi:hypothetical protein [Thermocatellispora tengchongensis]|uniref:hypothetical protein n=1 Tax=Thermocatellispora tengchongensis TaxID=1073253 RepID=UPI003628D27B
MGEERPTVATLARESERALGAERTRRCLDLVRWAPLTRRSAELAALAGLLIGTRELGTGWWERSRGGKLPPPDEVVWSSTAIEPWVDLTVLEMLAAWIADDSADARWGGAVGSVDLNSWQAEDRVRLPAGVKPGERLVVSFDAGGRLDAVVVRRADDGLGSNLDFSSLRYSRPAEAQWSWGSRPGSGRTRWRGGPRPVRGAGGPVLGRHAALLGAAPRGHRGADRRPVAAQGRGGRGHRAGRLDVAQRRVVRLVAGGVRAGGRRRAAARGAHGRHGRRHVSAAPAVGGR